MTDVALNKSINSRLEPAYATARDLQQIATEAWNREYELCVRILRAIANAQSLQDLFTAGTELFSSRIANMTNGASAFLHAGGSTSSVGAP